MFVFFACLPKPAKKSNMKLHVLRFIINVKMLDVSNHDLGVHIQRRNKKKFLRGPLCEKKKKKNS